MSDEPLRIHRSAECIGLDDAPMWTKQFSFYLDDTTRQHVQEHQRQWFCWWENEYVVSILYKHFDEDAVWAVVSAAQYPEDIEDIAQEVGHVSQWIVRWNARIEAYVRFRLSPRHDRPLCLGDIAS